MLSFENNDDGIIHTTYFLPKVVNKSYNVMTDRQKFFDQPMKNDQRIYGNIRKIAAGQGDDYATSCLLDFPHLKEQYKIIAINFIKQQDLDDDPKANQKINFTGTLDRAENTIMFFVVWSEKNIL